MLEFINLIKELTAMTINFTGIKNPQILISRHGSLLDVGSINSDESINRIRMKCYLDNTLETKELSEFKRVITQDSNLSEKFSNFTDKDCLQIDISPSRSPRNFGYSINLNGAEVNQWDKSIFGICTFLCAITKSLLNKNDLTPKLQKYIKVMNIVSDRIGKESLKYVK